MKEDLSDCGYEDALRAVLKIRRERRKIYDDDWKQQADWKLLAIMEMKLKRLEAFVIGKKDEDLYEGKKDCLIDLTNYALFSLQNLMVEGKRKKVVLAVRKKVRKAVVRKGTKYVERVKETNHRRQRRDKLLLDAIDKDARSAEKITM